MRFIQLFMKSFHVGIVTVIMCVARGIVDGAADEFEQLLRSLKNVFSAPRKTAVPGGILLRSGTYRYVLCFALVSCADIFM